MLNLETLIIDIPNWYLHFVLITGNLSAKSSNWSAYDTTTSEGSHLDSLMTLYGLSQLIPETTHILEHSFSCICLIFTNQPNLTRDSEIHPTLHPKRYHQINYSKQNFENWIFSSIHLWNPGLYQGWNWFNNSLY